MSIFPVTNTGGGHCFAFPDVCKTPTPAGPVPIPYPNIAMLADGDGSKKVHIKGKDTLRKGDHIRLSSGDDPGTVGGVVSGKVKGRAEFLKGWSKVHAEGREVSHLTVPVGQNLGGSQNIVGIVVSVSQ